MTAGLNRYSRRIVAKVSGRKCDMNLVGEAKGGVISWWLAWDAFAMANLLKLWPSGGACVDTHF
jgi:hypothetical protein